LSQAFPWRPASPRDAGIIEGGGVIPPRVVCVVAG
jgi:hypothetical protein